jgi:hypothetical protein
MLNAIAGVSRRLLVAGLLTLALLAPAATATIAQEPSLALSPNVSAPNLWAQLGQDLTVRARVDDMLAYQGFTLTPTWLAPEVLVVSAPLPGERTEHWTGAWPRGWREGSLVEVTGRVTVFRLADYEREFGVDVEDRFFQQWEGQPVLFARAVRLVADN